MSTRTARLQLLAAALLFSTGGTAIKAVALTKLEFRILAFLMQNPGKVFSRDKLLSGAWEGEAFVVDRTVDVHVRRLRAKLGGEHEALIGTVRNVGYVYVPPGAL